MFYNDLQGYNDFFFAPGETQLGERNEERQKVHSMFYITL